TVVHGTGKVEVSLVAGQPLRREKLAIGDGAAQGGWRGIDVEGDLAWGALHVAQLIDGAGFQRIGALSSRHVQRIEPVVEAIGCLPGTAVEAHLDTRNSAGGVAGRAADDDGAAGRQIVSHGSDGG